jgi:hypothetical protein
MATSFGNDAAAKQALKVWGELRGIATKVGQRTSTLRRLKGARFTSSTVGSACKRWLAR